MESPYNHNEGELSMEREGSGSFRGWVFPGKVYFLKSNPKCCPCCSTLHHTQSQDTLKYW